MAESLYSYIKSHVQNGELPEDFSLPPVPLAEDQRVRFADGAADGIALYHFARPQISDTLKRMIMGLFEIISKGAYDAAKIQLAAILKEQNAFPIIDEVEGYIVQNSKTLNLDNVFRFGVRLMTESDQREEVKIGMMLLEPFNEPNDALKDAIRTLALSDEFTLFAAFHMKEWQNGNEELFRLAQKVHGWGRIHVVDRLEGNTPEIRQWLLHEGIQNDVMPAYSAKIVYDEAQVYVLLKGALSDEQLTDIAALIEALIDEGPVQGMSAIEERKDVVHRFLGHAANHPRNAVILNTVYQLLCTANPEGEAAAMCEEILDSEASRSYIAEAVKKGECIRIAEYLEMEYRPQVLAHLREDFSDVNLAAYYLMDDEKSREELLDLYRKNLPLKEMTGEPTAETGYGKENRNYQILEYLVQLLGEYPDTGTDLILCALQSKMVNPRFAALRAIKRWCEAKSCSLEALSPVIYEAVQNAKAAEISADIQKLLKKLEF